MGEAMGRQQNMMYQVWVEWSEREENWERERELGERERTGREDKNQCVNRGRNHLCDQLKTQENENSIGIFEGDPS